MTPKTVIPTVPETIQKKVARGKPLTPRQKLAVLKQTRSVLDTNYAGNGWRKFIDGVEHFCLYGAMEKVSGVEPDPDSDDLISQCSLTSTLYDSIPNNNSSKSIREGCIRDCRQSIKTAEKNLRKAIGEPERQAIFRMQIRNYESDIMNTKVGMLQRINDNDGQKAVIAVVDKAIKALEKSIEEPSDKLGA